MPTFSRSITLLLLGLACLFAPAAHAQELDCTVEVDYRALTGNDYQFLDDLEVDIEEYMNERVWTQDRFKDFERIDCNLRVVITEAPSLTRFRANLVLATRRPIYGTPQFSTVAQFADQDWEFTYAQGTPLTFQPNRYDPITSLLDFYVFLILGYDYDTFSEMGGTKYFERAREIAERAEALGAPGWTSFAGDEGRVQLVEGLLNPRFEPLRSAYFTYHFGGLDQFVTATEEARTAILEVLETLRELSESLARRGYVFDVFFNTKYQELADIFLDSPVASQAYDLLSEMDPNHLNQYNRLIE